MSHQSASKNTYKRLYNAMATKYGKLFLRVIIFVIILFIGYLWFSAYTLRKSQEDIKACYAAHIQKADSLYVNLIQYSLESVSNLQSINGALLADSLIKYSLGSNKNLSEAQFNVLATTITQHYNEVLKMHEKNSAKLQKDSLFLSTERILLEGQTKNMIDLHLSKIEHEYNNITMWAALLTVIFLVFSFYSIFKMDELIKQGDDGLKDIRKIREEGRIAVEKFKQDSKDGLEGLETKTDTAIREQNTNATKSIDMLYEKIKEIDSVGKSSFESIEATKKAFEEKSQENMQSFENNINTLTKSLQKQMEAKIEEFNSVIIQVNSVLEDIKKTNSDDQKKEK